MIKEHLVKGLKVITIAEIQMVAVLYGVILIIQSKDMDIAVQLAMIHLKKSTHTWRNVEVADANSIEVTKIRHDQESLARDGIHNHHINTNTLSKIMKAGVCLKIIADANSIEVTKIR